MQRYHETKNLPIAKGIYKTWTFVRKFTSTQNKTHRQKGHEIWYQKGYVIDIKCKNYAVEMVCGKTKNKLMVVEIRDIFVRNKKITHAPQHDHNIWVGGDIIRKMKLHTSYF